jgi:hypothetical protein
MSEQDFKLSRKSQPLAGKLIDAIEAELVKGELTIRDILEAVLAVLGFLLWQLKPEYREDAAEVFTRRIPTLLDVAHRLDEAEEELPDGPLH